MNLFSRVMSTRGGRRRDGSISRSTALALAERELERAARRSGRAGLVLVDGRSGSGKTQFADELAQRVSAVQVLRLDDLYPDWEGLEAGVHLATDLVRQWSRGQDVEYTPTHWPGTEARPPVLLDSSVSLIVEGVGSRRTFPHPVAGLAPLGLYLDVPDTLRRDRALARDGETYAPYWQTWASQEERLLHRFPVDRDDPDLLICTEDLHA